MGNSAEVVHSQDRMSGAPEPLATQVQKTLYDVLKSVPFRASKQSQQLLQYIVDQSLAGHLERLKERIIGAEVFGRRVDYDTNEDPIVRARAAEVRKRLAQYYVGEGNSCQIRIEISPGSYLATFSDPGKARLKEPVATEILPVGPPAQQEGIPHPESSVDLPHSVPDISGFRSFRLGILSIALVLAASGIMALILRPRSPLEKFWSPLLGTSKSILISDLLT